MKRYSAGQSYLNVATQTASPGHLVLMLYEGAIRFLERALVGFASDDPAESNQTIHNNISRAQAILDELTASLDVKSGGEFATRMQGLYAYMDRRLQESNMRKEPQGIDDVIARLTTLRDAWREMLAQAVATPAPAFEGLMAQG